MIPMVVRILCLFILFLLLSACGGGSTKENPHNVRFIPGSTNSTSNETNTTNNDALDTDSSDEEEEFEEKNFVCPTNDAELSIQALPEYIAVGDSGNVQVSTDGIEWETVSEVGTTERLNAVVKGSKVFVAVGNNGTALCSPNGWDWFAFDINHENDEAETEHLYGLATNGNQFLIVGANGAIYTNESNTEWVRIGRQQLPTDFLSAVWGRDQFIIVGGRPGENSVPTILRSQDGIDWSVVINNKTDRLSHVKWSGEEFFAGGYRDAEEDCEENCEESYLLYRSRDGYTWTTVKTQLDESIDGSQILALDGDLKRILALGRGYTRGAEDSPIYFSLFLEEGSTSWSSLLIDAQEYKQLVVDGADSLVLESSEGSSTISFDGKGQAYGTDVQLNDLIKTDLKPFTACPESTLDTYRGDDEPIYYGSRYVVVGSEGTIYTSHHGEDWVLAESNAEITRDLVSVTRNNNGFYAVGDRGVIVCSRDGFHWNVLPSGTDKDLVSIASDGNRLVAVGEDGIVLTSPNGIQWDHFFVEDGYSFQRVRWLNNTFIALGGDPGHDEQGYVLEIHDPFLIEADALKQEALETGVFLQDITWANNKLYAVGYRQPEGDAPSSGVVLTRSGSDPWLAETVPDNENYIGMRFDSVTARGNTVTLLGKGFIATDQEAIIIASNNQVVHGQPASWTVTDFIV